MSSIRDRLKGKAQQPGGGDYPDIVKFEDVGDEIAGNVTSVRDVTTDYGEATVIAVDCEVHGEEVAFFATNHNLRTAFVDGDNELDRPVRKGDGLYARYEGKSQTKNGNTVKNFAVAVDDGGGSGADDDGDDEPPF